MKTEASAKLDHLDIRIKRAYDTWRNKDLCKQAEYLGRFYVTHDEELKDEEIEAIFSQLEYIRRLILSKRMAVCNGAYFKENKGGK